MNPERNYCTCCRRKFNRSKLVEVYYNLLRKSAFHCQQCLSANADNLHFKIGDKEPYLIELFSGSKTVSKSAESFCFKTFSVDYEEKFRPSLVSDMFKIRLDQFPAREKCFIVWASLPCTYFSVLNIAYHWEKITYSHRKYFYVPVTQEAKRAVQLLEKTLWLIRNINPVFFFIENPRGALRHMPQVQTVPFMHSVSYADFGMPVYKPTDLFTNCPFLSFPPVTKQPGKKFDSQICDMSNAFARSVVPEKLIESILRQILRRYPVMNSNTLLSQASLL